VRRASPLPIRALRVAGSASLTLLTSFASAPASASLVEAREAESRLDFPTARAAWREALTHGDARARAQARERLDWLEARRDLDGGLLCLTLLEQARQGGPSDLLERSIASGACGTVTAAEGRQWRAGRALADGRAEEALQWTLPAWQGRHLLPPDVAGLLGRRHAEALARLGREEEARRVEAETRTTGDDGRSSPVDRLARERTLTRWTGLAWGVVVAFGSVALPLAAGTLRRHGAGRPWGLIPLTLGVGGAWAFAELWEPGLGRWGGPLLLASVSIHLTGAWAAGPAPRGWRRILPAGTALATIASAWIVLDGTQSFGLLPW
jgi:hypothetical protein